MKNMAISESNKGNFISSTENTVLDDIHPKIAFGADKINNISKGYGKISIAEDSKC